MRESVLKGAQKVAGLAGIVSIGAEVIGSAAKIIVKIVAFK